MCKIKLLFLNIPKSLNGQVANVQSSRMLYKNVKEKKNYRKICHVLTFLNWIDVDHLFVEVVDLFVFFNPFIFLRFQKNAYKIRRVCDQ